MEGVKGKLTNQTSNEELVFSINPTDFHVSQGFQFAVEPCVGEAAPLVGFRSGEGAHLSFALRFDKDADRDCDISKALTFFRGLNKIDEKTKSVPVVQFQYGSFVFTGFVNKYSFHQTRFDPQGAFCSATFEISLISNGGYENGKT